MQQNDGPTTVKIHGLRQLNLCILHPDNEIMEVCQDCGGEPICQECKSFDHDGHLVTELPVYLE